MFFMKYNVFLLSNTRTKNVQKHILAPAAVACDTYLVRRSAHPWRSVFNILGKNFPNILKTCVKCFPLPAGNTLHRSCLSYIIYKSALQIQAAILLPPFRPLATIDGVSFRSRISSLDCTTFTNPTGTAMISSG